MALLGRPYSDFYLNAGLAPPGATKSLLGGRPRALLACYLGNRLQNRLLLMPSRHVSSCLSYGLLVFNVGMPWALIWAQNPAL